MMSRVRILANLTLIDIAETGHIAEPQRGRSSRHDHQQSLERLLTVSDNVVVEHTERQYSVDFVVDGRVNIVLAPEDDGSPESLFEISRERQRGHTASQIARDHRQQEYVRLGEIGKVRNLFPKPLPILVVASGQIPPQALIILGDRPQSLRLV